MYLASRLALALGLLGLIGPAADAQSIMVWGDDSYGQVSNVPTGTDFIQVDGGRRFLLALRQDGSIAAWGADDDGQVSAAPAGAGYVRVSAGAHHGLALRADGSIEGWGSDALGLISNIPSGNGFVKVSAGGTFSIALHQTGALLVWGTNWAQPPIGNYLDISASESSYYAVRTDGSIVGGGQILGWPVQLAVPAGNDYVQVSCGSLFAGGDGSALRSNGMVETWGGPSTAPSGSDFLQVASSTGVGEHEVALRSNGVIEEWGIGATSAAPIPHVPGFSQVSCGFFTTSALFTMDFNGNGILDTLDIQSGVGLDCNGNGVLDAADIQYGVSLDVDGDGVPDECVAPPLGADVYELSVAAGGTQTFALNAPMAGQLYLLLGTTSGTSPGLPVGSFVLPLNGDLYFALTLTQPSHPPLVNSFGVLLPSASGGSATASFVLPPGIGAAFIGMTLHHAYLAMDPWGAGVTYVSNPAPLTLLP